MKVFLFLIVSFFIGETSALAGEFHGGASYLYMQMHYKEPAVMDEKGSLRGIGLDGRYDFTESLSLAVQAKFLSGELEYNGATFAGTPIKQTTKDQLREYRSLVSYDVGDFSTYSGYGIRYWRNDLVISYVRETTYHYIPIGLRYTLNPFYFTYEFRHFLNGVNKSHMSDVDASRNDVTLKQESGKSYSFELGFFTEIATLDFKISVNYEYWEIEDSKTASDGVDTLIEPHNSTSSFTLSAGLFF